MTERVQWNVVALIACTASALIWLSSPFGIGTSPDSIAYMLEARALGRGAGLLERSAHHPPLYPVLLWLAGALLDGVQQGARVLHAALFGLNAVLFALLVRVGREAFPALPLACTLAFALSPALYDIHYMAWSEPPFFTFLLLHLLAMRAYLEQRPGPWLPLAGACLGAAVLTRYAGGAFIGATAMYLLVLGGHGRLARLRATAVFLLAACALPAAWLLARAASGEGAMPRTLDLHPLGMDRVHMARDTVLAWFQRDVAGLAFSAVAAVLAAAIPAACAVTVPDPERMARRMLVLLLLGVPAYVLFLLASISLFDFHTRLDSRILSPVLVLLLAALALSQAPPRAPYRWLPGIAAALVAVVVAMGAGTLAERLARNTRVGLGYFSEPAVTSPLMRYLSVTPLPVIYSNAPEFIEIHFDRAATALPAIRDPIRDLPRAGYERELEQLVHELRAGRAVVVYFMEFSWRRYMPGLETFVGRLRLPARFAAADGIVFGGEGGRSRR